MSPQSPIERLRRLQQATQDAPAPAPPSTSPPAPPLASVPPAAPIAPSTSVPIPVPPATPNNTFSQSQSLTPEQREQLKADTEQLWKSYEVINELIRFADVKAGALLTLNGVLLGVLLGTLKLENFQFITRHPSVFCMAVATGGSLVVSAIYSLLCIHPRVKSIADRPSIIYFGAITRQHQLPNEPPKPSWFKDRFKSQAQQQAESEAREAHVTRQLNLFETSIRQQTTSQAAYNDIKHQVWNVSHIADAKHANIIRSITSLYCAGAAGLLLLLFISITTTFPTLFSFLSRPAKPTTTTTTTSTQTAKPRPPQRPIHAAPAPGKTTLLPAPPNRIRP